MLGPPAGDDLDIEEHGVASPMKPIEKPVIRRKVSVMFVEKLV